MTVESTNGRSWFGLCRPFGFIIAGALLLAWVWVPMMLDPRAYRDGQWRCSFSVPWRLRGEAGLVTTIAEALMICGAFLLVGSWIRMWRELSAQRE